LGPYIRRSIGLSLFNPGPQPVARLGRNPRRCSNPSGCASFDRAYPHTVLHPLGRSTVFQDFVTRLPSRPTRRRSLTLDKAPFPSDWWLPSLTKLGPLPPSHFTFTAHQDLLLAWTFMRPLDSAYLQPSSHMILGESCTTLASFGLAIRLMVDGHYPWLCFPTCPRFPSPLPGKLLGSDGGSISHPPDVPTLSDRNPRHMITPSGWDCMDFRTSHEVGRCGTYPLSAGFRQPIL